MGKIFGWACFPAGTNPAPALLVAALLAIPAAAQSDSRSKVDVTVYPQRVNVARGEEVAIAVILDHQSGWHTHTHAPELPPELDFMSGTIIATEISVDFVSNGLDPRINLIQWPKPTEIEVAWGDTPAPYKVYDWRAIAYLPVAIAADAPYGAAPLNVSVRYQACDDAQCLQPASEEHTITLNVVASDQADTTDSIRQDIFGGYRPMGLALEVAGAGVSVGADKPARSSTFWFVMGGAVVVAAVVGVMAWVLRR